MREGSGFEQQTCKYTIDGIVTPRSVTGFLHAYVVLFNLARAVASMSAGVDWEHRRAKFQAIGVGVNHDREIGRRWRFVGKS
eukprot:12425674-Karenia_brevis.AAC.1